MPTTPPPVLTWDDVQTLPEKVVVRNRLGETLFACQARSVDLGPYLLVFDESCEPVPMLPGYMVRDGWRLRGVFADGTFVEGIYRDGLIFCGEHYEFTRDQFAEVCFIPAPWGSVDSSTGAASSW